MATYEIYSGIVSSGINLVGGYYYTTPMYIYSGGIASHTTVGSDGRMTIYAGGSADDTLVNYSGFMFISSGATATNITANPGARIEIAVAPDTYIQGVYGGNAFEMKDGCLSGYTIYSGNYMHVYSGGSADDITLSRGGYMYGYAGGYINDVTVNGYLSYYGSANNIVINSGGTAYLHGMTSNVTVMSGGSMEQGGSVSDVVLSSGGYLRVGGIVSGLDFVPGAGRLVIAGNDRLGVNIDFNSEMTGCLLLDDNTGNIISSGSEISDITVSKYQSSTLMVFNGGIAKNITLDNVYRQYAGMAVFDGGIANSLTVSSSAQVRILSGGSAQNADVKMWGMLLVEQGGYAANINLEYRGGIGITVAPDTYVAGTSGGSRFEMNNGLLSGFSANGYTNLTVVEGGSAINCSVECASMNICGGEVNNINIYSSGAIYAYKGIVTSLYIHRGGVGVVSDEGVVNYASVSSGGFHVRDGGNANSTTVNAYGSMLVSQGGLASNTTMSSGCMYISSGGIHRGSLQIGSGVGAVVSAYSGAIIDFTVSGRSVEDNYLINDLSLINGTPTYTVSVDDSLKSGTYKLAQGAENLTGTLTIGDGTINYGTITVNGPDFVYNDVVYSLDNAGGNLTLTVKAPDFISPELTITGNPTEWTNKDVVLKVSADEECDILYQIGSDDWQSYTNGITLTVNATVNIKATDLAGNVTEKSVVVDMIDKIAPNKPSAVADITTPTNGGVAVSATFSSDSVVKQYSFDNKTWKTYSSSVVMEDNGTVYFRSQDEAGNYSEVTSFNVTNIDKVAPTLEISGNAEAPTNQDVVLTATASDGTIEYFNGKTWVAGNKLTVSENGTYKFRVTDAAGNVTEKSVVVDMIDKVAPTLEISGNVNTPTNKDVVLTATASDGVVEYFANGKWNIGSSLTVTTNGTYKFRVTDAAGNVTEKSVTVDMIDKVAPTLEINGNVTAPTNKDVVLTATVSDGTIEYFANGKWNKGNSITATENGTFKFRVTDEAGNVTEKSVTVDMIDKVAPTLEITGNAEAPTNKDVVLTATASDGTIEYFANGKWNIGSSLTVTTNGTYKFRVTDVVGNVTEKSVVVNMIDKVAPTLEISGNVTAPTNKDVVLTATASDGTVEYFNGKDWVEGNSITATENGTYQFRVTDAAGNITEKSVTVDMIDKVAPTLEINGNIDTPTNKDVVLTATASDGAIEYFANGKWNKGNSITATDNGTYKFRVTDAAGNITEKLVTVDMIDKVAPTLEITGNATEPTNQDVVLTATASDGTIEYFADGKWNKGNSITATENGTFKFRVTDEAGNVTEKSIVVDKIDKVAPTLEISGNATALTNQDVVLTATASDGTIEYFANGKWNIGSSLTVTTNGTYQFRVTDEAGNVTEKSVTVDMIDKIAPNKPSAVADITTPTNGGVAVSATFSSDSVVKQYSFDNKTWKTYSSSVAMEDNGTVYFRSQDEAGNYSAVTSYTVSNIDKVAPTLNINGNPTMPTNQDVTLTAAASDGTIEYYDGAKWIEGNKLTVSVNGTYQFRVTDAAGNVTEKSVVVSMIDKTAPNKPSARADITTTTNGNVTVSATFSSDSVVKQYSLDNKTWKNYTSSVVMENNGTVYFRGQDEAGNYSAVTTYNVTNIDKVAPVKPSVSADITTATNQNVTVSAVFSSDSVVKQYSLDNRTWQSYISGVVMENNGTVYFRSKDEAGNYSTVTSYEVTNIDKVAPTLSISGNATAPTNQDVELTATASDGTVEYYDGKTWVAGNKITVSENGTYQFRVTDEAGNVTEKSVVVDMIDKVAPTLEITGNATEPTNQDVVLTATASDGTVEYFANGKWNIGSSLTVTTNGTYQFRVTDEAGNVTEKSVVVDMIDKVAPTLKVLGNVTKPINNNVLLLAVASDGIIEYFDGKSWIEGDSLLATENGTYKFRVTDEAGNVTEETVVVDMIDKVAPDKPAVKADITSETTGAVTVSAIFSNDSVITEFSLDNKTWQTYTDGVVMESNGTVYFRGIDAAGNVSQVAVYEVNNIIAVPDVIDGDLDGNGLADVILRHTQQGFTGAWLTTGDESVIKWGNLSDIKDDVRLLGTGRLYGSENDGQDIFFADSKTVGAWNVVDGKVTGYKSIMSVNATTNVIGLGDFNGDGATDLLLRSTSGDLGFYGTDGTGWEYLIGLGKEWSVAAIGDLNGDGLADTIVRHDAGFAGTFLTQTDGTVKWANLDTLSNDMTIVGTGDFNGDGVDDVLLQNKSNGWVGAWLVEDGRVDSFIGLCTNKNTIEQIADFNGDGIDDLRVRDGKAVGVLYVNGADNTTWQYFQSVGKEWDTSFALIS